MAFKDKEAANLRMDDGKNWPNRRPHTLGARQYGYWFGQTQRP
jgi:hypothetical protein